MMKLKLEKAEQTKNVFVQSTTGVVHVLCPLEQTTEQSPSHYHRKTLVRNRVSPTHQTTSTPHLQGSFGSYILAMSGMA